jgi:uncharacterized protein (TIGR03435 family)
LNGNTAGENIPASEAIEKQLGLKLEQRAVPTPVLVVDSVKEEPTPNPPGTAEALPPISPPSAFEVADIRPTDPDFRGGNSRLQNGRFTVEGMPMMFLLSRAFDAKNNNQIAGLPADFNTLRFNMNAKLPADVDPDFDVNSLSQLLRNLLIDRFRMKYHTEERPQTIYTLVTVKPKMKQADPASRTGCKSLNAPPGSPQGTVVLSCRNTTMEQLTTHLRGSGPQILWSPIDETGLERRLGFYPDLQPDGRDERRRRPGRGICGEWKPGRGGGRSGRRCDHFRCCGKTAWAEARSHKAANARVCDRPYRVEADGELKTRALTRWPDRRNKKMLFCVRRGNENRFGRSLLEKPTS